jgi:hypothetical protein
MRLHIAALSICFLAATLTGCASLGTPKPDVKAELSKAGVAGNDVAGGAKVDIIFQPDQGQPERLERALTEPTTVQQLLVQSGALKKYRRIEVELLRPLQNGGSHKIPCEYDLATKQINPENDYALMPGDRVVVKEDPSTIIDDMMRSAGGNLGQRFTTGGRQKTKSRYRLEG